MLHFADDAPVVMRTHVRTEKCMGVGRELGTAADKKNLEHSYTFLMPDSWRLSSFLCTIFSRIYTIKACKLEGKVLEANSPRMCEKRKITATTICCSTDKDIALMSIALGEIEGRRTYEECESSAVIIFCALLFPFDDSRLKKKCLIPFAHIYMFTCLPVPSFWLMFCRHPDRFNSSGRLTGWSVDKGFFF